MILEDTSVNKYPISKTGITGNHLTGIMASFQISNVEPFLPGITVDLQIGNSEGYQTTITGDLQIGCNTPNIVIDPALPLETVESDTNIPEFDQSEENFFNKNRFEKLRLRFTEKLLTYFVDEDFEYGIKTKADILVKEQLAVNTLATKSWLNDIFVNNFANTNVLMGILRIIARIDYSVISPEGPTLAIAVLSHKDIEIQECGIRAFESWGTLECLKILLNIKTTTPWLMTYVNDVISDLQKEHNIVVG